MLDNRRQINNFFRLAFLIVLNFCLISATSSENFPDSPLGSLRNNDTEISAENAELESKINLSDVEDEMEAEDRLASNLGPDALGGGTTRDVRKRAARMSNSFIRLGKSNPTKHSSFIRFGRSSSFIRFGRGAPDGGGDVGPNDDDDDDDDEAEVEEDPAAADGGSFAPSLQLPAINNNNPYVYKQQARILSGRPFEFRPLVKPSRRAQSSFIRFGKRSGGGDDVPYDGPDGGDDDPEQQQQRPGIKRGWENGDRHTSSFLRFGRRSDEVPSPLAVSDVGDGDDVDNDDVYPDLAKRAPSSFIRFGRAATPTAEQQQQLRALQMRLLRNQRIQYQQQMRIRQQQQQQQQKTKQSNNVGDDNDNEQEGNYPGQSGVGNDGRVATAAAAAAGYALPWNGDGNNNDGNYVQGGRPRRNMFYFTRLPASKRLLARNFIRLGKRSAPEVAAAPQLPQHQRMRGSQHRPASSDPSHHLRKQSIFVH